MSSKVMLIGLDGATWILLRPWILRNKLPTFRKITDSGYKATLLSTIPSTTAPALTSMLTGMNQGNHGIFSFIKSDGSPMTLTEIEYPKIWNVLDENGFRSCIVNVRCTYPPEKINGLMVSGTVPSDKSSYIYPEEYSEKLKDFRNDGIERIIFQLRERKVDKRCRNELVGLLIEQTRRKYNIFKKLNQEMDYDFSMLWIEETDFLQHGCWEFKDTLLQLYTELDNILGDLILTFPDRDFFIVSDHGFESRPERFFYINTFLQREGWLREESLPLVQHLINFFQHFAYRNLHVMQQQKILRFVRFLPISKRKSSVSESKCAMDRIEAFLGVDKERSKAYLTTLFGIKIKESGSAGSVQNEIIDGLLKLRDEAGERAIRGVWKREEIFKGRYLSEIPEIIFLVSEKYTAFPVYPNTCLEKLTEKY